VSIRETPARILVVEDNPADIVWLRHALDQQGEPYVLEVLADGEAAIAFVDGHRTGSHDPQPCVIVLDLHLPRYNGIEVLRAIKRAPVLSHIHVVMLSSRPNPSDEEAMAALGAIFRLKPSRLIDCLELACEILAICKGLTPLLATAAL
jgi:CheY-like chemotaxis protein